MTRSIQFTLLSLATVCAVSAHAEESETRTTVKAASLHISIVDRAASTSCTSRVPEKLKKALEADLSTCVTVVPLKIWVNAQNPDVDAPTIEANYVAGKRLPEIDLDPVTGPAKVEADNVVKLASYLVNISTGCYGPDVVIVQKEGTVKFETTSLGVLECTVSKGYKKLLNSRRGQQAIEFYSEKKAKTLQAKEASEKYLKDLKAKTFDYSSQKLRELADVVDKNK